MKFFTAAVLLGASTQAAPWTTSYLARMADSFIRRGVNKLYGYGEATLYTGFEYAYALSKNGSIVEWYRGQIDGPVVLENGSIPNWRPTYYSLDDYRIGNNILWWYERTGEQKYATAAEVIRRQLDRHPRTPTGGFWHRSPIYRDQMWLDGIFMADTFYARWTGLFDRANATAWDDVALQFDKIEARTRNHTTNLLVHGYDEGRTAVWADPVTGAAPLVWNRAVGWYFLSLVETIPLFPADHPGRARLEGYFATLAEGLKNSQDASGGWWLVMSEPYPGMPRNYLESSAAAMFTAGWLRGMRLDLLDRTVYGCAAQKAYRHLVGGFVTENAEGTVNWEGTVQVGSLNSNATFQYYTSIPIVQNDSRGGGAFMMATYEWELLNGNTLGSDS